MSGAYRASQFVVTSYGHGGVIVVDPTPTVTLPGDVSEPLVAPAPGWITASSVHRFVAAAGGLACDAGALIQAGGFDSPRMTMIAETKPALA